MATRGRELSIELQQHICDKYIAGVALREIAKKSKVSQTTIMKVLRKNEVPLRDGKQISEDSERLTVELYKSGESIARIMAETGIRSEQTIYRILRESGVEKRRKKAAE